MPNTAPSHGLGDAVFQEAARRYPTPFYLYDEAGIRRTARALHQAFAWAPHFREYFAVKALPNPSIHQILIQEGCGLDCSSPAELELARRLSVKGDLLMYSANAVRVQELIQAHRAGATINLDALEDAQALAEAGAVPGVVSLRINPGFALSKNSSYMGDGQDSKFGLRPDQLLPALLLLKEKGLSGFGLHAMTVSASLDPAYQQKNAAFLLETGLQLAQQSGLPLRFINLSGGLGIPYQPGDKALDIHQVGALVRVAYEKALGQRRDVAIFMELGRFMTGPHGYLLCRVNHHKTSYRDYIGLDASSTNLMRPMLYGSYHHVTVPGKEHLPKDQVYDLTGALCENSDKLATGRPLPRLEMGDLLVFHNAGAHGHAMGYQYNGRLRSAELLYTQQGGFRLIRRAETVEDYLSTLLP